MWLYWSYRTDEKTDFNIGLLNRTGYNYAIGAARLFEKHRGSNVHPANPPPRYSATVFHPCNRYAMYLYSICMQRCARFRYFSPTGTRDHRIIIIKTIKCQWWSAMHAYIIFQYTTTDPWTDHLVESVGEEEVYNLTNIQYLRNV